jgi:hypothetical protein
MALAFVASSSRRALLSNSAGESISIWLMLTDTSLWIANFELFSVSISNTPLFLSRKRSPFLRLVSQKQHPNMKIAIAAANPAPTPMMVSLA